MEGETDVESAGLPVANLPTVNLSALNQGKASEAANLLDACKNYGFFYLDLNDSVGQTLVQSWDRLTRYMDEYFAQPLETKLRDEVGDDTGGYKPAGIFPGVENGRKDCFENLKIHRATLYSRPENLPVTARAHVPLLRAHMSACDDISTAILSSLSSTLNPTPSPRLEDSHRRDHPSTTFLGLLNYPAQTSSDPSQGLGHNKHTDIGTLTVLLATQPGLQVLTGDGWRAVAPREGHTVVNVGDSLRFLTGNALRSCVHRVDPVHRFNSRYSICYFLRPEDGAAFRDAEGREITAREWHDGKYVVFRQSHAEQAVAKVLTGGMEKAEVLVGA